MELHVRTVSVIQEGEGGVKDIETLEKQGQEGEDDGEPRKPSGLLPEQTRDRKEQKKGEKSQNKDERHEKDGSRIVKNKIRQAILPLSPTHPLDNCPIPERVARIKTYH